MQSIFLQMFYFDGQTNRLKSAIVVIGTLKLKGLPFNPRLYMK